MPTRTDAPTGAPVWILLQTTDEPAARSFYGQVFGWEGTPADATAGGYFTFSLGADRVAGCSEHDPIHPQADTWMTYFATSDAHATTQAAAVAGASVLVEPTVIATQGTMAVVTDPGGAVVGLWQPDQHHGFLRYGEPGTPGWFDLETGSYEQVLAFYRDALGWTTRVLGDTDAFRYVTLVAGDEQLAGIKDASGTLAPEVAPSWTVVFCVTDTDATVGVVEALGGSVLRPASDSPYGRLATVTDPMGAKVRADLGRVGARPQDRGCVTRCDEERTNVTWRWHYLWVEQSGWAAPTRG